MVSKIANQLTQPFIPFLDFLQITMKLLSALLGSYVILAGHLTVSITLK